MAGFEVVVRPVVLPNIRPQRAQPVVPQDDEDRGVVRFGGSSGQLIDLSLSDRSSYSRSRAKETKRRFDEARIYKKDDAGNVDRDTFVDVEVMNKVWLDNGDGTEITRRYANVQERDNIEILRRNVTRTNT